MEWIIIVLMLAGNAVFAAYEMALASVSRARLEILVRESRRGAQSAAFMKDRLEASLSVIQLGITLASAIAAATGGAEAGKWLSPWIKSALGVSAETAEVLALLTFVLPLSAITIVFAELVPKMIGINNKEAVVLTLSPAMRVVSRIFRPVVFVFEMIVKRLARVVQGRRVNEGLPEEQSGLLELRAAAALARATRVIGPLEERIVVSAVQLSTRTVAEALVPASDVATIPASASLMEALVVAHMHMHTRYPVCGEARNPQSIEGYVTFKDIVAALKIDQTGNGLRGILRPISRIEPKTTLAKALADMIQDRVHIALVAEETRVLGLLTVEDLLEELVGDLHDEYDRLPAHIHPIGGGWLAGGGALIASLREAMGDRVFSRADPKLTLADWVSGERGSSVLCGDLIQAEGMDVLVRKVRRNRVSEAVIHEAKGLLAATDTRQP